MAKATTEDVRKAVDTALEQVKTSLLAALGAGNLAGQAVADAVGKARGRVTTDAETAKKNIEELPSDVREKLEPAELRKLLDEYTEAALKLYHRLAESGEETLEKLREQPHFKKNLEQVEEVLHTAQERIEGVTGETRERVDEVISRFTGRTKDAGESVTKAADKAADKVEETTAKVADKVEETAEKAAPKTQAKSSTTRKTGTSASTTRKTTGGTNGTGTKNTK